MKFHNPDENRFIRWLVEGSQTGKSRLFIKPLLVVFPPGMAAAYYGSEPVSSGFKLILPTQCEWCNNHVLLVYFFAVLFSFIISIFYGVLDNLAVSNATINDRSLFTLLEVLEIIVSYKADRFEKSYRKFCDAGEKNPAIIFANITQPDQQINFIAQGLHTFFDKINEDGISFKVSIAPIVDGKPTDKWAGFAPGSVVPTRIPSDLDLPDSTLVTCIKSKGIVIIEDIKEEAKKKNGRKFHPTGDPEEGSIICFPVLREGGEVAYVLSIVANKKSHFLKRNKQVYQKFLQHFALRIRLEDQLKRLKIHSDSLMEASNV